MLNPFDDSYDDTSYMVYTLAPMLLIALLSTVMLWQKAMGSSVNIILLTSTFGLMIGMLLYHIVDMNSEANFQSDVKKSGFFGYMGMIVGIIIGMSILVGKKGGQSKVIKQVVS
jgi:hypothetical protein